MICMWKMEYKSLEMQRSVRVVLLAALLFGWFSMLAINAQKAVTVKSFAMTTDHIPSGDRRNDLNGAPCALIKIQVVDEIDRIEGNNIGEVINRGVEKWVYMCKGSRNMRIHLKNHLPVRVIFKNHKINGLQGNRVYELVLNVPDQAAMPASVAEVSGNKLQIKIDPPQATVYIWGEELQRKVYKPLDDGTITVHLPYGRYHYEAKAEGYNNVEGNVFVNDEDKWEDVKMVPIQGTLFMLCSTKKVEFYVDNQRVSGNDSQNTWIGQLTPGSHAVEARRDGYATVSKTVEVRANQTTSVNFGKLLTDKEKRKMDKGKAKVAKVDSRAKKAKEVKGTKKTKKEKETKQTKQAKQKQTTTQEQPQSSGPNYILSKLKFGKKSSTAASENKAKEARRLAKAKAKEEKRRIDKEKQQHKAQLKESKPKNAVLKNLFKKKSDRNGQSWQKNSLY